MAPSGVEVRVLGYLGLGSDMLRFTPGLESGSCVFVSVPLEKIGRALTAQEVSEKALDKIFFDLDSDAPRRL